MSERESADLRSPSAPALLACADARSLAPGEDATAPATMMLEPARQLYRRKLQEFLAIARRAERPLLTMHNDPDPDAMGAAVGLQHLLRQRLRKESAIAFSGIIGRAENKAMVQELGLELLQLSSLPLAQFDFIVLVDAQPGAGNQPLPPELKPHAVVDHHRLRPETQSCPFWDVRGNVGATSTIVASYLRAAGVRLPPNVATALFYGIKADTLGLARGAGADDVQAYIYLQRCLDAAKLARIEGASVSPEYFRALDQALHRTSMLDGLVVARLGEMRYPDMAAEVADMLRRLEGSKVVLAIGHYAGEVIISLRSSALDLALDELLQKAIRTDGTAGGHGLMAAGRVPATLAGAADDTEREIVRRFAALLGVDVHRARPLLREE